MLRITMVDSAVHAKDYFRRALSRGEYYTHEKSLGDRSLDQELLGSWGGRLADRLGLSGEVSKAAFERLCDNRHPQTGDPLTPRTRDTRRVGYDCTFSVPKSVSLLAELGGDERIVEAFRDAVRETMREMEADVETRVRLGGANDSRVTGNMGWAEFIHKTARPVDGVPDPHLHAHCVVFNATWDPVEQRIKALDFGAVKRDAPYFQAACDARMKTKLNELGYAIERRGKGWEIAGASEYLVRSFSRRTEEVERLAEQLGIVNAERKASLAAKSRAAKLDVASMDELRAVWRSHAGEHELPAIESLAGAAKAGQLVTPDRLDPALTASLSHLLERRSMVRDRDLVSHTLNLTTGGVSPEAVHARIEQQIASGELLRGSWEDEPLLTTPAVHAEERAMLDLVYEGRGRHLPLASDHTIADAELSAEQRAAVRHVLESIDSVAMIRGRAGVGKTRLMHEVVGAIEGRGQQVIPVAVGAKTTDEVLRNDGFTNAVTIAKLLGTPELQERVRGGVIWIDEAGQVGVPDMTRVLRLAGQQGCRVLLTGDTAQHHAVQRGDAMKLIEDFGWIKPAEVATVLRQQSEQYCEAAEALSRGDIENGYGLLEAMGSIREVADRDRPHQLAEAYAESVASGRTTLVIAPTHAEGETVTQAIREALRAKEMIGQREAAVSQLRPRHLTEAEKADAAMYRPGDVVQFTKHVPGGTKCADRAVIREVDRGVVTAMRQRDSQPIAVPMQHADRFEVYEQSELGLAKGDQIRITRNGRTEDGRHRLNNGATYTVEGMTRDGGIRLENGWTLGKEFGHLAHGYSVTSHASQGITVDHVLIAQSSRSAGASNRQQFYVSITRGKYGVTIYTDDAEAFKRWVMRDASRVTASESLGRLNIGMPPIGPSRDGLRSLSAHMIREAQRQLGYPEPDRERHRDRSRGREDDGRSRDL